MNEFLVWFRKMVSAPGRLTSEGRGHGVIDLATARELIDFNASNIGQARADEQETCWQRSYSQHPGATQRRVPRR